MPYVCTRADRRCIPRLRRRVTFVGTAAMYMPDAVAIVAGSTDVPT